MVQTQGHFFWGGGGCETGLTGLRTLEYFQSGLLLTVPVKTGFSILDYTDRVGLEKTKRS